MTEMAVTTDVAKVRLSGGQMPNRPYEADAGFDLAYSGDFTLQIQPGEVVWVPCGVAVQWPPGMWGFIVGRSSTFRRGLLVNPTVIDGGWRGDLGAMVRNVTGQWAEVEPGQRLAQIVPMPLLATGIELVEVDELDPSDRGTNGFGSSGA